MFRRTAVPIATGLLLAVLTAGPSAAISSPAQPKAGPGAALDPSGTVVKRAIGKPGDVTYVFHMAAAPEKPRSVVVLLHAWGASNPVIYGAWIENLARRGHLVLFPGFQEVGKTKPAEAVDRAGALLKSALAELASDPQAKPDPEQTFYLGHSAGTGVAASLAARAKDLGIPAPRLIFALMPGGIAKDEESKGIRLADLSGIPEGTNLVAMSGDQNNLAADRLSRRILKEASTVAAGRKLFMRSASDDHGFPALTATLASPAGPMEGYSSDTIKLPTVEEPPKVDAKGRRVRPPPAPRVAWSADAQLSGEQRILLQQLQRNPVDTLDWLAYWRVFDMLIATTQSGADLVGLRQDPAFLDMGRWSDGWPVRRLFAETPKTETTSSAPSGTVPRAAPPTIQSKQPVTRRRSDGRRRR